MGGADPDLVEMGLYNSFREQDGEPYTLKYLINCRKLLIANVEKSNEIINELERK